MKRRSYYLILFVCLVVMFSVVGWLSYSIMDVEQQRQKEQEAHNLSTQTRLALWRIDSSILELLNTENRRAIQSYESLTQKPENDALKAHFWIDAQQNLHSAPYVTTKQTESLQKCPHILTLVGKAQAQAQSIAEPQITAIPKTSQKINSSTKAANYEEALNLERLQRQLLAFNSANNIIHQLPLNEKQAKRFVISSPKQGLVAKAKLTWDKKEVTAAELMKERSRNKAPATPVQPKRNQVADPLPPIATRYLGFMLLLMQNTFQLQRNNLEKEYQDAQQIHPNSSHDNIADIKTKGNLTGTSLSAPIDAFQDGDDSIAEGSNIQTEEDKEQAPASLITISSFAPVWDQGELYLLRNIKTDKETLIQGIWIDWEKLSSQLLDNVKDLLPSADLQAMLTPEQGALNAYSLATIPAILLPKSFPSLTLQQIWTPLQQTLFVAWCCAFLAAIGISILILGIIRLNERRSTFVSAVTHELRTPLTTFNMYTEMLVAGFVPEKKMQSYFNTLHGEASRLTHLIDNVLSFSRLEKRPKAPKKDQLSVHDIADEIMDGITPCLNKVGMDSELELSPETAQLSLTTNVTSILQILQNLADNATKYAYSTEPPINIHIHHQGNELYIDFKDHGEGIPTLFLNKLFVPFSRSAEDAAGKQPGVGLGLALSHQMAKSLGGALELLHSSKNGTSFRLKLQLD